MCFRSCTITNFSWTQAYDDALRHLELLFSIKDIVMTVQFLQENIV